MILTIDVGNSHVVSVLYNAAGQRIYSQRRETVKEASYQRYREVFATLDKNMDEVPLQAITLSCVVPYLRPCLRSVIQDLWPGAKYFELGYAMVPELDIRLSEPREIGADLIATAYGALKNYAQPTIIADLGSASKITVVDAPEVFLGGIILPGIPFQAKSLHQMIPHLPHIPMEKPDQVIGNDTAKSIQSGIIYGTLGAVLNLGKKIEQELGRQCTWVITGGAAKLYSEHELERYYYDEFLLSDGLYYLTQRWLQADD